MGFQAEADSPYQKEEGIATAYPPLISAVAHFSIGICSNEQLFKGTGLSLMMVVVIGNRTTSSDPVRSILRR